MKMKLGEVISRIPVLVSVSHRKLPFVAGFAINRTLSSFAKEQALFDAQRQKLCENLCDKDESGKPIMLKSVIDGRPVESYKLSDEAAAELSGEIKNVLDMDVEVDVQRISMEMLEKIDTDTRYDALTPEEIRALEFMITKG